MILFLILYLCVGVYACVSVCWCVGSQEGQKKASVTWNWIFRLLGDAHMGAEEQTGALGVAITFDCWSVSPAPMISSQLIKWFHIHYSYQQAHKLVIVVADSLTKNTQIIYSIGNWYNRTPNQSNLHLSTMHFPVTMLQLAYFFIFRKLNSKS